MMKTFFPRLFEPCNIGTLELPNRIVMPPMSTNFPNQGFVSERLKDYYVARARGGAGLIIVEDAIIDYPLGCHMVSPLRIDEDRFILGLRSLVKDMKCHGVKTAVMLNHAGRRAGRVEKRSGRLEASRGQIPVAPSSLPNPAVGYVVPRELSIAEIEDIVAKFADAAVRAREAGFDAVQLHCAHFYLINQFLSPWANKRTDRYGGDFEGRFRFLAEIIAAIRERVGNDYPLICRINVAEQVGGGLTQPDMQRVALKLQDASVNAIMLSILGVFRSGFSGAWSDYPNPIPVVAPARIPPGPLVPYSAALKRLLRIPVCVANKINSPAFAEKVLSDGAADLVAMGRTLRADPELPNKAREGRLDDIRPCIGCGHCSGALELGRPTVCSVNAALGRERELELVPTSLPKKVVIVGGGPAGMEAARVGKLLGHDVMLGESSTRLGGQLAVAAKPPGKSPEVPNFQEYLENQVNRLGIKVCLGKPVDAGLVKELKPDVLIMAVGAKPLRPEIPGIDRENVVTAVDILEGKAIATGRVAVLGGGQVGLETAEYLAERGHEVTVIEMLSEVCPGMPNYPRHLLLMSLQNWQVNVLIQTKAVEITGSGVVVEYHGQRHSIQADTVVLALGATANRAPLEELKGLAGKTYVIGDCAQPRKIIDAIREGYETAASL